jgi:predicted nucleic acid-binding protein
MANLFLDTNIVIDLLERQPKFDQDKLEKHEVFISPLSLPILAYLHKYKVPNPKLDQALEQFHLVSLDTAIMAKASQGPTTDLEDNIQLHSARQAKCHYFLTTDKALLKLARFGKIKITNTL